jgi:hypothetical protein
VDTFIWPPAGTSTWPLTNAVLAQVGGVARQAGVRAGTGNRTNRQPGVYALVTAGADDGVMRQDIGMGCVKTSEWLDGADVEWTSKARLVITAVVI